MRSVLCITLALVACVAPTGFARAEPNIVFQFFYELSRSPENGDELIAKNRGLFDESFDRCLLDLLEKFEPLARDHYGFCDRVFDDSDSKRKCGEGNEPAKMHHWLREFRQVTLGNVRWSETYMGSASIVGKRALEDLSPGKWESIVVDYIPPMESELLCD